MSSSPRRSRRKRRVPAALLDSDAMPRGSESAPQYMNLLEAAEFILSREGRAMDAKELAKAMQDERLIKPRSVRNRDLHRSVKGAIAADIKKNPLTPFNVGDVGRRKKSTAATATGKRKKGRPRKNAKKVVNEKYSVTTQRRRSRRQMQRSPSPPPCTDGSTVAVLKTEVTPVHLQRTSWRRKPEVKEEIECPSFSELSTDALIGTATAAAAAEAASIGLVPNGSVPNASTTAMTRRPPASATAARANSGNSVATTTAAATAAATTTAAPKRRKSSRRSSMRLAERALVGTPDYIHPETYVRAVPSKPELSTEVVDYDADSDDATFVAEFNARHPRRRNVLTIDRLETFVDRLEKATNYARELAEAETVVVNESEADAFAEVYTHWRAKREAQGGRPLLTVFRGRHIFGDLDPETVFRPRFPESTRRPVPLVLSAAARQPVCSSCRVRWEGDASSPVLLRCSGSSGSSGCKAWQCEACAGVTAADLAYPDGMDPVPTPAEVQATAIVLHRQRNPRRRGRSSKAEVTTKAPDYATGPDGKLMLNLVEAKRMASPAITRVNPATIWTCEACAAPADRMATTPPAKGGAAKRRGRLEVLIPSDDGGVEAATRAAAAVASSPVTRRALRRKEPVDANDTNSTSSGGPGAAGYPNITSAALGKVEGDAMSTPHVSSPSFDRVPGGSRSTPSPPAADYALDTVHGSASVRAVRFGGDVDCNHDAHPASADVDAATFDTTGDSAGLGAKRLGGAGTAFEPRKRARREGAGDGGSACPYLVESPKKLRERISSLSNKRRGVVALDHDDGIVLL